MRKQLKGSIAAAALLFAFTANATQAYSQADIERSGEISRIQNEINKSAAKWVAGETSLSNLPEEEWRNLVGLSFEEIQAAPLPETYDKASLPPAMDWRSKNGNFVTPIRNQQQCGSCWAFAMTGALESYVLKNEHRPGTDLDLSEQVMLSCSGAGSCNGGRLNGDFLQRTGLPAENIYPYTGADGTCSSAAPGWQNSTYRIDGWGSVSRSVASMKSALAEYGPYPTAMMVYEDFMHYKSGIYSYTTGKRLGGHAVILVGYNDPGQYFVVKNSWGTGWGEDGFFKIAYSELNTSTIFGLSSIAYRFDGPKDIGTLSAGGVVNADTAWARVAPMFEAAAQWN